MLRIVKQDISTPLFELSIELLSLAVEHVQEDKAALVEIVALLLKHFYEVP